MKKVGLFRSIHIKFVLIYMVLIIIAMQIIGVYFNKQLERELLENYRDSLRERVSLLVYNLEQEFTTRANEKNADATNGDTVNQLLTDFRSGSNTEVRVIDRNGEIIAISNPEKAEIVGKKSTEILVKKALVVGVDFEELVVNEKNHRLQIVVQPIKSKGEILGAVHVSSSVESVFEQMDQINRILFTGTFISLLVTGILGTLLAQTITRPIADMRKQALEMAKGNYSRKVKVYGYDEIGQLSLAFNNLSKKLQEARATTEGERRKLSSVLSHMTDGVIATDRNGKVILINDPAIEMIDTTLEEMLNKNLADVLYHHLEEEEDYTLPKLNETQEDLLLDWSTDFKPLIIKVSFSTIQKQNGAFNGLIAILYDVTEQEKIEQERRDFVANVSHELRTPLTTMRSYIEALAEGAWEDKQIAPQFLEVTQTETERMIRLVNDLLQLSKMDATDYKLMKEWVNFTTFYNRIIDRFEMTKPDYIVFERNFGDSGFYIEIDTDKITQVIDNIISNAMKYSPEGGKVTFRLKERGNMLEISITDEGMGIPRDNIKKIFDRFYRVDRARSRKMGGTGLGLAIAKEMIRAHGGNIWARSIDGKGTTIFFTLPYEDMKEEDEWE
ncbi:MAG: cell wall metabolism sensor histidine kinase WalK [Bacilli bacterium]